MSLQGIPSNKTMTPEEILKNKFENKCTGYSYDNVIGTDGFTKMVLECSLEAMTEYASIVSAEKDKELAAAKDRIAELEKEVERLKDEYEGAMFVASKYQNILSENNLL